MTRIKALLVLALAVASPVWAVPSSTATLDWAGLTVTAPVAAIWDSQATHARAFVSPDGTTFSEPDWTGFPTHTEAANGVTATGSAVPATLTASLSGDWAGGPYIGAYPAQANTWRTGGFTLQPGETITVTVPYTLAEDTSGLAPGHVWSTTASLWLWNPAALPSAVFLDTEDVSFDLSPASGTLSVSWTNDTAAAYSGEVLASATNYLYVNAVPEPQAAALMLGGLALLAGMRRKGRRVSRGCPVAAV